MMCVLANLQPKDLITKKCSIFSAATMPLANTPAPRQFPLILHFFFEWLV